MSDECRIVLSETKSIYVIKGNPIAWSRAGHSAGRFYDRQKHEKLACGLTILQQHGSNPQFLKPLHLDATFYFHIPKTHARNRHKMVGKALPQVPDLDNLIKFICDTCSGVLFKDDALVSSVTARKLWGEEPRTEFSFTEIE